jgi:dTDP-4-dehydrorhamnose reductase
MGAREPVILVTGGDGKLATALRDYLPDAIYLNHDELDVTRPEQCKAATEMFGPETVIHAAAATHHAEQPEVYESVNVRGTVNMLRASRKVGARFVYCSTDYVYPGGVGMYREDAITSPVNEYATSKLSGELVVQTYGCSLILRGSWYSGLQYQRAATDAFSSKVPTRIVAPWVATLSQSSVTGIVNVGGARRSMYEIALEYNERVTPCLRTDLRLNYLLPKDTSLDTGRMRSLLGL